MPIQFDNFDQNKIDRLKNHLSTMADKNKAKFYEIFVDTLKAVPKTDEISDFDAYEDYITVDTEQIKIVIYNTALSPRNDQYVFVLKAKNREDALNLGLNGMPLQKHSKTSISQWRETKIQKSEQEVQIQNLKREIARLEQENQEKGDCIYALEKLVEKAKKNGNRLGGYHIGDILSVAVEGLVTRNKSSIAKIPLLSGLAGLVKNNGAANLETETKETDTEVSFQKMDEATTPTASPLNEEDAQMLELIKKIYSHFNENEFGSVLDIIEALSEDKTLIAQVLEFVNELEKEEEEETKQ
jgi:hypothetical protein